MVCLPAYDLRDLVCFLAVVDHGSISAAASELHLTQPAVSQRVRALEAALATPLLTRTSKGVRPTTAGERVAENVPVLLAVLRGLEQQVRESRTAERVLLGSSDTAALHLLPEVIARFRQRFPECQLTLLNRESRELMKACADGSLDLALVSLPHAPPRQLTARIVKRAPFVAVGARRHPVLTGGVVARAALAREPLVLLARGTSTRTLIDRWFEAGTEVTHVTLESSNLEVIKSYAAQGWGLTILPEWALSPADRRRLSIATLRPEPARMAIALVHSSAKRLSGVASALFEMLATSVGRS